MSAFDPRTLLEGVDVDGVWKSGFFDKGLPDSLFILDHLEKRSQAGQRELLLVAPD